MSDWTPTEFWKNFRLGSELSVSGNFIYNGIYCFDLMDHFCFEDESFEFLYDISVGLERLQKIVLILLTHKDFENQDEFEKSLITHNHQELNSKINKIRKVKLGKVHHEFLNILVTFYKTDRYGKYSLNSVFKPEQASKKLISFIEDNLNLKISTNLMGCTPNSFRFKKFIGKIIGKFCKEYYRIIKEKCNELNIYTYEVPFHSKSYKIFMAQKFDFEEEKLIQNEILKYLLQKDLPSNFQEFLKIKPALNLEIYDIKDYIDYLLDPHKKNTIIGEIEDIYADEIENIKERLNYLKLFNDHDFYFDNIKLNGEK